MSGKEAQKLMRTLIKKYDADGDGKFNYSGNAFGNPHTKSRSK